MTPLNLDCLWNEEHRAWLPEKVWRDKDDELIGELDLAEEMKTS